MKVRMKNIGAILPSPMLIKQINEIPRNPISYPTVVDIMLVNFIPGLHVEKSEIQFSFKASDETIN